MAEKWMQELHLKKDALRKKAKRANALDKNGKISTEWEDKKLKSPSTSAKTKKQIVLAKTFAKARKA